ncbi:acyl-CoA Delta-9 desaturase [Leptinotarsa decemlineata]|uniref:acyl-CoA Delta-9 desaturase n=1 Tax=Leptinotarsa decemlineata TaxID=7539 RepID=UPI003D30C8F5
MMTVAEEVPTLKPQTAPANNWEKEQDQLGSHSNLLGKIGTDYNFKRQIVWKNAIGFLVLHLIGFYGIYCCLKCHIATVAWMVIVGLMSAEGVTFGAHRLYSHKCFKATFSLRLILILLQTVAGQNCLYIWARDHRQHHKFSDTDADPHNASRGFFFSHIGWLMSKKHPAVIEKGKTIDMSDLEADPLVMFQKKYYKPLYVIFAIVLPVIVPVYAWNETYYYSFLVSYMARYIIVLNATWSVNSIAHLFGTKPFDKFILPVESTFVAFISVGEGWHNYHHTFPWDYRAAELGSNFMLTTFLIDLCSYFGLTYDLKTASFKMVEKRLFRTGDGTHPRSLRREKIRWLNGQKENDADSDDRQKVVDDKS